jgi:hypothetical protein
VDGGPGGRFTKRLDPRAQGRAYFKRKRLSHVTVVVGEQPPVKKRKARAGASVSTKRAAARRAATSATKSASKSASKSKRTRKAAEATAPSDRAQG